MLFNIISCIIKLISNLFIISFSFFLNNDFQKKITLKLLFTTLDVSLLLPILAFFRFHFDKIKIFIKFIFSSINLNNFLFSNVFIFFIIQISYFVISTFFVCFILLKLTIVNIKAFILRNSIGFFIIMKKPIEFLNIATKLLRISNFSKLFLTFIKIFNTYLRINYILLTKYSLFLNIIYIYITYFTKISYYLYIITLQFYKINIIKLIKISINITNIIINIIIKFYSNCRNLLTNLFLSILILIYTFIIYFFVFHFRKYIKFLTSFVNFHSYKIALLISYFPLYLYNNFRLYLKQSSKIYIYALQSIYIYFRRLFKVLILNLSITIFYKKLKTYIIKTKFNIYFLKNIFKNSTIIHFKYIDISSITLSIAYIGEMFNQTFLVPSFNIITAKLLRNKFIIVINLFLSSLAVIILIINFHFNQIAIYIKSICCFIYFKIKQKLIYIVQKTCIRILYSIRRKIMLFMSPRQKFHFYRYPILRRVRRRIRIIIYYSRSQSRYVTWNLLNHCFSIFFLVIRFTISFLFMAPFKFINIFLYPNLFIISFVKYIIYIIYKIIIIPSWILNNLKIIFINIIFKLIQLIFDEINNFICVSVQGFNLFMIKLNLIIYKCIYVSILIINQCIYIFIHLLQLYILILSICLNNIINIIIILYTLIQYIIMRILEIFKIICKIILKLSYKLFYYSIISPIAYILYLLISIIYIISILIIDTIKQIVGIYRVILYLPLVYCLIPIKYLLKPLRRGIKLFYFYDLDYRIDYSILRYLKFWYNVSYAFIGLIYYGTIFLCYESLIFISTNKRKILSLLLLIYIYIHLNVNEIFYCITLTPNELIDYLIKLTSDLSREFTLYLNHLLVELQTNILTYETLYIVLNSLKNIIIISFVSFKNLIISLPELLYELVIYIKNEIPQQVVTKYDNIKKFFSSIINHKVVKQFYFLFFDHTPSNEFYARTNSIKKINKVNFFDNFYDKLKINFKNYIDELKINFNFYIDEYSVIEHFEYIKRLYKFMIFQPFTLYLQNNYNILMSLVTLNYEDILININAQFSHMVGYVIDRKTFMLIDWYIQSWVDFILERYDLMYSYIKSGYFLCNIEIKIKQQLIIFLSEILIKSNLELDPTKIIESISRVGFF